MGLRVGKIRLCSVCKRERAVPPSYLFCEPCWLKARARMKAEDND